jgi:hypothetical protein
MEAVEISVNALTTNTDAGLILNNRTHEFPTVPTSKFSKRARNDNDDSDSDSGESIKTDKELLDVAVVLNAYALSTGL